MVPKSIDDICKSINISAEIQNKGILHGKSATFTLKKAMNDLIGKLKKTVSKYFYFHFS